MQKNRNRNFVEKKVAKLFFSNNFFWGGGGIGNHLKHVEMQKKKIQIFFQNGRYSGHIGLWTKSKI